MHCVTVRQEVWVRCAGRHHLRHQSLHHHLPGEPSSHSTVVVTATMEVIACSDVQNWLVLLAATSLLLHALLCQLQGFTARVYCKGLLQRVYCKGLRSLCCAAGAAGGRAVHARAAL